MYGTLRTAGRRVLAHRITLRTHRRLPHAAPGVSASGATPLLARVFSHPDGAGIIGPGTDGLLRALLIDALADGTEAAQVIVTRSDLERMFLDARQCIAFEYLSPALHVTETLEDGIELIEGGNNSVVAPHRADRSPILWLATPGADADVVHPALRSLPDGHLVALFNGAWPYGPTHVVDATGPRQVPALDVDLPSPSRAIARLRSRN